MDESRRKGNQGEAFEHYRVLLFSIAYRMTGSASDAEDLVQETYLRYQANASQETVSLKAYLSTIITRLALDYLKSARVAREQYIGAWLPEPILTSEDGGFPLVGLEQQEALSLAFLRLLEALSPPERAVFLLHEVFDYPFSEIGSMLEKSPAILFWEEGSLAVVISLTLSAVGIQEIYALLNPEKLAYLQKQLSSSRRRSSFES